MYAVRGTTNFYRVLSSWPSLWRQPSSMRPLLTLFRALVIRTGHWAWKSSKKKLLYSCTSMIVARGVFAWFPAGYRKSSCYQLLAFVYDFKLKWSTSRGTERMLCLCYRWCWLSSLRILAPYESRSRPVMINSRYNIRQNNTDNLAQLTTTRAMNPRPFFPSPSHVQ